MFQAMKWMKSIDIEGKGFITEQVFKDNRRGPKTFYHYHRQYPSTRASEEAV